MRYLIILFLVLGLVACSTSEVDRLTTENMNFREQLKECQELLEKKAERIDAAEDSALAAILAHNRDEELEHAAMLIEWLRRENQHFDKQLRRFLFTEEDIVG